MDERVFGIETEYAVAHEPFQSGTQLGVGELVMELKTLLREKYGLEDCDFLCNGSKFYYDVGHAEWCVPECRSAREAAVYDKAADYILASLVPALESKLADQGHPGRVMLVKNNVDVAGNTWGCHENYMTEMATEWLHDAMDHLRLTIRAMIPHLVTRQIFCGAGRAGWGPCLEEGLHYQIAQRADFITTVVSKETTCNRAIVNLSREAEPLMRTDLRRLHLILGDANLSGWATWMKLGVTGIILRMIEDLEVGDIPHLADPVAALQAISRDVTCRRKVALRSGQSVTAVDIQRAYLNQADSYFERYDATAEEQSLMSEWRECLDTLERDPMGLGGKVDWVTKKSLLDRLLKKRGQRWGQPGPQDPLYFEVLKLDIDYHRISRSDGLFYRLLRGRPDTLINDEEIRTACTNAPPYTRARIRGDVIASARRTGLSPRIDGWDRVEIAGHLVQLPDALRFMDPTVVHLLALGGVARA